MFSRKRIDRRLRDQRQRKLEREIFMEFALKNGEMAKVRAYRGIGFSSIEELKSC